MTKSSQPQDEWDLADELCGTTDSLTQGLMKIATSKSDLGTSSSGGPLSILHWESLGPQPCHGWHFSDSSCNNRFCDLADVKGWGLPGLPGSPLVWCRCHTLPQYDIYSMRL